MTDLLQIPEGAERTTPHVKFVANVPPGVQVEAYRQGDQVFHAVVLPVMHCSVSVDDNILSLPDADFKERVLAPMLMNLGSYAKHKTEFK